MEKEVLLATNFKLFLSTEYVYTCIYRRFMNIPLSTEELERVEILIRINMHSYLLAQSDQSLVGAATIYLAKKCWSVLAVLSEISGCSQESILKMSSTILEEESYMLERFG